MYPEPGSNRHDIASLVFETSASTDSAIRAKHTSMWIGAAKIDKNFETDVHCPNYFTDKTPKRTPYAMRRTGSPRTKTKRMRPKAESGTEWCAIRATKPRCTAGRALKRGVSYSSPWK